MTYTTLQLDIIREFGSKELTEGCYITYTWNPKFWKDWGDYLAMLKFSKNGIYEAKSKNCFWLLHLAESEEELNEIQWLHWIRKEILWHIPHLEDVFRVAEERWLFCDCSTNSSSIRLYNEDYTIEEEYPWDSSTQPIDQDESTLTQLLTLFTTWETNE